ncbi:GDSL-type esterase/lipase family protein [Sulfurimonas sp.]|uniref:GDSL-type esterase/lipase family protein n=1 Tax=Sulfurimonas sp. TaxID=2022749 RepID=UPI003D145BFC
MRDVRICYVGDSFVNGTGDQDKLGWTGRLSASSQNNTIDITHYNLGIRRDTSTDILKRWEAECQVRLPEVSENKVVFSFGVNDTVVENGQRRVSLEQSISNAKSILLGTLKKYDVLMIGMPPIDDEVQNRTIKELDAHYQLLCKELNVSYLSIYQKLIDDKVWMVV